MKIAIASGKGGTGKTTVAINLALAAQQEVCLVDCDVDAPNAHLFLACKTPRNSRVVTLPMPVVDESLCDGCSACSDFCAFNAIVSFGTVPVIAPDMCHGCGGCARICPRGAIREVARRIGVIDTYDDAPITLIQGRLDIGVALAPPLIRAVKQEITTGLTLIDAPPGTSCPVVATLRDTDFVVLVTEPTPFGLNDLVLAVETVRALGLRFGVVINRAQETDSYVRPYLSHEKIPLLAEIPDDRRIAQAYAVGMPLIKALPEYAPLFSRLLTQLCEVA